MSFFKTIAKQLTTRKSSVTTARTTMFRAWEIAKQASKHFNLLPASLLQWGLSKPSDFFKESLKLAWDEVKNKVSIFENTTTTSRKSNKLLEQVLIFAAELTASGVNNESNEFKIKVSSKAQRLQCDKRSISTPDVNVSQLDMFSF